MSSYNSHKINLFEQAVYDDIERVVSEDGYTFDALAEFAGYDGVNSLRNIVRQAAHSLSFARGAMMLKELSKRDNFRVHRHVIDGQRQVIKPRVQACKENLRQAHDRLLREIHIAELAVEAGNVNRVYEYYRFLLKLASRVQLEMGQMQVQLQKESDEGRLRQALRRAGRSTPGDCSARRLMEPNVVSPDLFCVTSEYTPLSCATKAKPKVEVTDA